MLILPFFVVCNHADGHCDLGHALLDLALHVPAKSKGKIGVKIRFLIFYKPMLLIFNGLEVLKLCKRISLCENKVRETVLAC